LNRFIFILLLLSLQLCADSLKVKTFTKGNLTNVHLGVVSKINDTKSDDFITHILVKSKNEILYDIKTSPYIGEKPRFIFKTKKLSKNDVLDIFVTYNSGQKKQQNFKVASQTSTQKINKYKVKTINKEIKQLATLGNLIVNESINVQNAINEVFPGISNPIKDKVKVVISKVIGESKAIPININSDIKLESVAIFTNANQEAVIAYIRVPENGIINYSLYSKAINTTDITTITVVGKGKDGKFYKTVKEAIVYNAGFCCS